jgi:hypothetical protein
MTTNMPINEKSVIDSIEDTEMQTASSSSKLGLQTFDNLSNEDIIVLEKRYELAMLSDGTKS